MISIAVETLVYRRTGFSPVLSLLMPTFAFLCAPINLTIYLRRCIECSPTTYPDKSEQIQSFGTILDARLLSMLCRSTSELLRTL
jgi:hypothetical protein